MQIAGYVKKWPLACVSTNRFDMNFFLQNLNILRNKKCIKDQNDLFPLTKTLDVIVYDNFTVFPLDT